MIISVNWLKQFTEIDASIDELADVIGSRLVEIEGVEAIGAKYTGVVVARIVRARPVEDSDHLNVTYIDDGRTMQGVERGDDGLVQVVCGAPNVREGMRVAWLPPGSTVPETFGDDEPFVLGARTLRGYMSNGMLASARELDLFDSHDGIVEVDRDVAPGTPFADAYALDDYLLDIENKSLTHRPDTFGIVGFAREVAAIGGKGFGTPEWLLDLSPDIRPESDQTVELSAAIDNTGLSRRYSAVVLDHVDQSRPTPLDIQTYLSRSGVRPISPVVDVTNYLMLLTGQPLHAFDYDKVLAVSGSSHLHVREGHVDETLALLDGRTLTLSDKDIVITAGDTAVALAGAMGGRDTEIDAGTTRIILESATFDLYRLRATQMRHGIFSEAITRFTKGQPPELTLPVLARACTMLAGLTGARVASALSDAKGEMPARPTLTIPTDRINGVLGTRFNAADIVETLRNVEFDADADGETVSATPPCWRTDIHIDEDLIEEIGRLNGFDLIEPVLPQRPFSAVEPDAFTTYRGRLRDTLSAAGANEVLTYSFVHGDLIRRTGGDVTRAYALANAISPDLHYYRLDLTPSLLSAVTPNIRAGFNEFALYEIGKVHAKDAADPDEPDLPAESHRLAFVYAADQKAAAGRGNAYYTAKRYLEHVLDRSHCAAAVFTPLEAENPYTAFEPKRSARVSIDGIVIGVIGEYRTGVATAYKLPAYAAGFEIELETLFASVHALGRYTAPARYQGSSADVTFVSGPDTSYAELSDSLISALSESGMRFTVTPAGIYIPEDAATKSTTLHIEISSPERTLSRDDVSAIVSRVSDAVCRTTGSTLG